MRSPFAVVAISALWTILVAGSDGGRHFRRASNGTATSAALITSAGTAPEQITATGLRRNDTTVSPGCGDVWISWYNSSTSWDVFFTTFTTTFTYHNITASTTTLCDGHPRVIGGENALTTVATGTSSSETATPYTYPSPKPTCRIPFSECTGVVAQEEFCTDGPTPSASSRDCGPCSIWGGTVDLYYFPVTATASRNLCASGNRTAGGATTCPLAPTGTPYSVENPYMQTPCDYLTDHITSTPDSGPYIVSEGNTFYENRVYLSLDTIYAENSCGYVGSQYTGRTITLASSAVHSVFGYHHEFYDVGYQFDFRDLNPLQLPADTYYANCNGGEDPVCFYNGDRYIFGRDFINGRGDLDLGAGGVMRDDQDKYNSKYELIWAAAHSPQILVPLEVRTLDPAWSTCNLNLVGLYDPPKALKGALTQDMPTAPSVPQTTTDAEPASTRKSDSAPATADPKPTATADPSPSGSADGDDDPDTSPSGDPSSDDEPRPTEPNDPSPTQQEPAQSSVQGSSPTQGDTPPSPEPSENDQEPEDPTEDSPASPQPSEDGQSPADPADEPQDPDQATTQPNFTFTPQPTSAGQPENSPPGGESDGSNGQDDPPAASSSTTVGLGGIIASVFSMEPAPAPEPATTTTNALSVLQSAAESIEGGNGPTATGDQAAPNDQLPSIIGGNTPKQIFEPITVSNDEQTHTLQPVKGSGGLFTIAPAAPSTTALDNDDESPDGSSNDAMPTEPIILTAHDGDIQTVNPILDSPGLYSMVPADPTPSGYIPGGPAFPFTGPVTYEAGGKTHTIRPVESTSGVFVIDGSRTVTRLAPTGTASGSGAGSEPGSGTGSEGQSTLADGESGLPPVVTLTGSESGRSSASASGSGNTGGDGGQGNGSNDVTMDSPAGSGAAALHISSGISVWVGVAMYVMFI